MITLEQLLAHSDHALAIQVIYYDSSEGNLVSDLIEDMGGWGPFDEEMKSLWMTLGPMGLPHGHTHPCWWASQGNITIHDLLEDALALGFVDQVMRVSGVLRRHGYDHHAQVRRPTRKRR